MIIFMWKMFLWTYFDVETKQLFYSYKVDARGKTIARWVHGSGDAPKFREMR